MMAGWMNRQQQQVIEYLVEENRVLREQLDIHAKGKRLRFNASQRRRLAEKGRRLGRKVLMEVASLVTPETIYAWHRKFVAMKFAPKGCDRSAAHARREERNALIIKLATENAGWGYTRIQGVMQSLGWPKLSTSTIGEVLRNAGIEPSPERCSRLDWKTFIRIHADQLAATDFFMVPVWTLRGQVMYRVHFVIDLLTRKVEITHIGCQYSGELMLQIGRNLTDCFDGFLVGKKWMLHDQDPLFTDDFRELLRASGTTPFKLPRHMPMMNGYAECFVKTIKRECLDKLIFFGEGSLRRAVDEFMAHYHHERPHQGLDNTIIEPDAETFRNTGPIRKIARLGGLLNHYYRDPAIDIEEDESRAA
jgi:putative transposase